MRRNQKTPEQPAAAVIVFARAPQPGRCKTRLIARYGARGAARLHARLIHKTLQTAQGAGLPVELWCAPDTRHGCFHACRRRYGIRLRRQRDGDLGRKMGHALAATLGTSVPRALIIGTDCAALGPDDLRTAASMLHDHDCVLQPAADGGYVLIGARRPVHAALRGIQWSSGREFGQTHRRLLRRRLSCGLLKPLWDVDHACDVRRARQLGLL